MPHPISSPVVHQRPRLRAVVAALLCLPALALAGEVKVFVAGAAKAAIELIGPGFTAHSGDTVVATYGTVGALRDKVLAGERPDAVILSDAGVQALVDKGLLDVRLKRPLGTVVTGLAIRAGAPQPDVSTEQALKRTLLSARSIAHADGAKGATSGAHFAKVIDALGIRPQLQDRLTVLPFGVEVMEGVVAGTYEIGVSQSSEIVPVPGLSFLGALPAPHGLQTTYVAASLAGSGPGQALLDYLGTAGAGTRLKAAGINPF